MTATCPTASSTASPTTSPTGRQTVRPVVPAWRTPILWMLVLAGFLAAAVLAQEDAAQEDGAPEHDEGLPLLVDVKLSADEITVGDRVEATLMVVWMGEATAEPARFPTWQESWGRAEILDTGAVHEVNDASGRRIWKQTLSLTAFRPGEVELPPVQVALPLADRTVEARTEAATFTVTSVLPAPSDEGAEDPGASAGSGPDDQAIPAPKGPAGALELDVEQRAFWWSTGLFSALLAICLVWTAGAVAKQPEAVDAEGKPVDPLRFLTPMQELDARLGQIRPEVGTELIHTGLSYALRRFLGRRLHFRAAESTTTEIQRAVRRAGLPADLHRRVVQLLRDADAAKFARAEVPVDAAMRRVAETADVARAIESELAATQRLDPADGDPWHALRDAGAASRAPSNRAPSDSPEGRAA